MAEVWVVYDKTGKVSENTSKPDWFARMHAEAEARYLDYFFPADGPHWVTKGLR